MSEKEIIKSENLVKHAEKSLKTYGKSVIEDRALPDYRDGLKPVHRRILWSMYKNNLNSKSGYVKSARVVGNVMGYYHPHGDTSIYQSMVKMTNTEKGYEQTSLSLIRGQGSWGWFADPPAAMRYTECKLSEYSEKYMLDKEYLKIVDMVSNFDGSSSEPLILPSLLPTILLIHTSGIAVGTTTQIPPFKPEGVIKLVKKLLKGEKVTDKDCFKNLEFNFVYGSKCISDKNSILEYFKTGIKSLEFECDHTIDKQNKSLIINGITPNFSVERLQNKLINNQDKNKNNQSIFSINDESDSNGIKIIIKLKDSVPQKNVMDEFYKIKNYLKENVSFKTNITIRKIDGTIETNESTAEFKETNIPKILKDWTEWRVQLELKYLKNKKKELKEQKNHQELLSYSIDNLDKIFKVLKSAYKNLDKKLSEELKISIEEAKTILNLQTRRLSNMSKKEIDKKISELKIEIKTTEKHIKEPENKILEDIEKISI